MRLLILGKKNSYETKRLIATARDRGHTAAAFGFADLTIAIADGSTTIIANGIDLLGKFDVLHFRRFYPYISEALMIAEAFNQSGGIVIDRRLAEGTSILSKTYETIVISRAGIRVPRTVQCFTTDAFLREMKRFTLPVIVKGIHGGLGAYVYLVKSEKRLRDLLETRHRGFFSIQEYLPTKFDIRVLTIGYRAIGAMRRTVPRGDFRANLAIGGSGSPYPLTPQLRRIAEKASRALRREFSGVDILIHKGKPYLLEVNQFPGFEGFEAATGIDVANTFIRYLETLRP